MLKTPFVAGVDTFRLTTRLSPNELGQVIVADIAAAAYILLLMTLGKRL